MLSFLNEKDQERVNNIGSSAKSVIHSGLGSIAMDDKCEDILYLINIIHDLNEEIQDTHYK